MRSREIMTAVAWAAVFGLVADTAAARAADCNTNGIEDVCDIDCGTSGGPCDVQGCGQSDDCNANGVPDECENDSDGDGVIDDCDVCDLTPSGAAVDAQGRPLGDINKDCDTDLEDYALFQQGFTGPISPAQNMVLVPGGEFEMGDHYDVGASHEQPVHAVYVDSFYMDIHGVTNQQYCRYLNYAYSQGLIEVRSGVVYAVDGDDPYCDTYTADDDSRIHWDGGAFTVTAGKEDHPMVEASWYGAAAYANWRSTQRGRQPCYNLSTWECDFLKNGYRLPTEAEWEYAARGGLHSPYCKWPCGNDLDGSDANYWESGDPFESGPYPWTTPVGYYDGGQTPPGSDQANGYGLYDMAGNTYEWCNDWYSSTYYSSSPYDNPQGPESGSMRILRGGAWYVTNLHPRLHLRCAHRWADPPVFRLDYYGFRLVLASD